MPNNPFPNAWMTEIKRCEQWINYASAKPDFQATSATKPTVLSFSNECPLFYIPTTAIDNIARL
jgi:hypothetical protein